MSRLQEFYKKEAMPQIMKRLKLTNPMAVPRISKITLNMGVGGALADRKVLDFAVKDLARISGQQPVICNGFLQDTDQLIGCAARGKGNDDLDGLPGPISGSLRVGEPA